MAAKRIMVQGTGSHVGKSVFATALCRLFAQDGYKVAPFKAQNMALNSFVTREGGEMGRSQVVQAEAAGVEPHVDMNPILLKPTSDMGSQVIVRGRAIGMMKWQEYSGRKAEFLTEALAAFERLAEAHDVIVIEGAGSPAEVNLREGDIVNMRIARETQSPVYLVTDIDRGGALAWVVGTMELLQPEERALVKGILINKFRGDVEILRPGLTFLEERIGVPIAGVIPYIRGLAIAQEDSVSLEEPEDGGEPETSAHRLDVAVVQVSRISNFTDVDALKLSEDVRVRFVRPEQALGRPDLLLLPGSKSTIDDLQELWQAGMVDQMRAYARSGGCIVGICGGYQMLGEHIADPHRTESTRGELGGIGLLPVRTILQPKKLTTRVQGKVYYPEAIAASIKGYEIHTGQTQRLGGRAWVEISREHRREGEPLTVYDGCCWMDDGGGRDGAMIFGTYVHGLFDEAGFRRRFLDLLRARRGWPKFGAPEKARENPYDALAETVRRHLDVAQLYRVMGL